jgi:hypothetical protein
VSDVRDVGQSSAVIPELQQQEEHSQRRGAELMTSPGRVWYRSSYCSGANSTCVEIALGHLATHVRDAKQPNGPTLRFGAGAWRTFVGYATADFSPVT